MIDISAKIKLPDLDLDTPDKQFWHAVGIEESAAIQKRTLGGQDAEKVGFKPYTQAYKEYRMSKGRSAKVNLTFTGKMLNSMARGIRSYSSYVKILLTGEQGEKAYGLERGGRKFFALSALRQREIYEAVDKWMTKRNKLKR